ncbi:MAG: ribosome maturation factor RimM [Cyclobacteriaceae bacterium]
MIKTHGLNGEISIFLDVDDPTQYTKLESVFVDINERLVPFFVESIHLQKENKALLALEDVEDIDTAKELVGKRLFLPLSALPKLKPNQYYFHQLGGFEVYDKEKLIGKVLSVYELPQNNLLAIDHEGIEILVPLDDGIVESVDLEAKKIKTNLPDGLIEVYKEQ